MVAISVTPLTIIEYIAAEYSDGLFTSLDIVKAFGKDAERKIHPTIKYLLTDLKLLRVVRQSLNSKKRPLNVYEVTSKADLAAYLQYRKAEKVSTKLGSEFYRGIIESKLQTQMNSADDLARALRLPVAADIGNLKSLKEGVVYAQG